MMFIGYEVESIKDLGTLEEMEMARRGEEDSVPDAASLRLEVMSQATSNVRTSMASRSLRSFVTMESYVTARTHISDASSVALKDDPKVSRDDVKFWRNDYSQVQPLWTSTGLGLMNLGSHHPIRFR
jgi:hypothetical protein